MSVTARAFSGRRRFYYGFAVLSAGVMHVVAAIIDRANERIAISISIQSILNFWIWVTRGIWDQIIKGINLIVDFSLTSAQVDALTMIVILFGVGRYPASGNSTSIDDWLREWLDENPLRFLVAILPASFLLLLFVPNSPFEWISAYKGDTFQPTFPESIIRLGYNIRTMLFTLEGAPLEMAGYGLAIMPFAAIMLGVDTLNIAPFESVRHLFRGRLGCDHSNSVCACYSFDRYTAFSQCHRWHWIFVIWRPCR